MGADQKEFYEGRLFVVAIQISEVFKELRLLQKAMFCSLESPLFGIITINGKYISDLDLRSKSHVDIVAKKKETLSQRKHIAWDTIVFSNHPIGSQ